LIVLAIIAVLAALAWTVVVFMANAMSDATSRPAQGVASITVAWAAVVVFVLAWWFN
jgi:hypothetical protein